MERSFLGILFEKLSAMKKIQEEAGINTSAVQKDVMRQIGQTSPKVGGNFWTGEGVTKSGVHD